MNDREIRCYSGEVRAERHDDNPAHIIGYGSVFDCRSELIFGSFRGIIRPGAFDDVLGDDSAGKGNSQKGQTVYSAKNNS